MWIAVFALSPCAVSVSYAQDKAESLPTTLEDAVAGILSRLSEQDKQTLRETPKKDLIMFHMGWGRSIRNNLGLWGENEALLKSACGGKLCHPDDASMRIMEGVWEALHHAER
jgi:hypothetical protein